MCRKAANEQEGGEESRTRTICVEDAAYSVGEATHGSRRDPLHVDHDVVLLDVCLNAGGDLRDICICLSLEVVVGVVAEAARGQEPAESLGGCGSRREFSAEHNRGNI